MIDKEKLGVSILAILYTIDVIFILLTDVRFTFEKGIFIAGMNVIMLSTMLLWNKTWDMEMLRAGVSSIRRSLK